MVRSRTKKVWRWMPTADEEQRLKPIMERMQRAHAARQQAAEAAAGGEGAPAAAAGGGSSS
jgi:hypothetical protein